MNNCRHRCILRLIRGKVLCLAPRRVLNRVMHKWREGSCFFPVYLSLQLESPWQLFCWSLSKFLPHTHRHSSQRCQSGPCMQNESSSVIGSVQSDSALMPSLCLFSYPPFLFLFLPLCRFCTAAADRKLRLLTSDLHEKHEVQVVQHLAHTDQNWARQLVSDALDLVIQEM